MQAETKKPMAVVPGGGRKILVLGNEITLKLTTRETNGEYFVFEAMIATRVPSISSSGH